MLLAAVPRYLREVLGASRGQVGFATTIFFAAALLVRTTAGRLIDTVGRRPFLVWPPLLLGLVALGFEFAHSVAMVAALRFVQGTFGSTFYTAAATTATDLAPPDRQASAIARLSIGNQLGFVVGPIVADLLLDAGFTWVWVAVMGFAVLAAGLCRIVPETRIARAPDPAGTPPARTPRFHRAAVGPGLAFAASSFGFASIAAFSPEYAQRIGISRPGTLFATYALSVLVIRPFTGRLADRIGPVRVAAPGLAIGAAALAGLALSPGPLVSYVSMAVVGFGAGSSFPALSAVVVARVPAHERGGALASFLMFNDVGQVVAGPAVGLLSDALGFRWVYGVPAIVVLLGAFAAARLRSSHPPRPAATVPAVEG
jgi:MFS family permease